LAVGPSNGSARKISSGATAMLMLAIPLAVVTSEFSTTPTLHRHRPLSLSYSKVTKLIECYEEKLLSESQDREIWSNIKITTLNRFQNLMKWLLILLIKFTKNCFNLRLLHWKTTFIFDNQD
jgi:hypothetical protein